MGVWNQTKKAEGEFDVCPADSYPACLVAMVDLGTHDQEYKDDRTGEKVYRKKRMAYLCWEVDQAKQGGGGNFLIGRVFVVSLHDKSALGKVVKDWRAKAVEPGEAFDLLRMLGKCCKVLVTNETKGDKTYHNFGGVLPLGKSPPYKPAMTPWSFEIDSADGIPDKVDELPSSYGTPIRDLIESSDEWKALSAGGSAADEADGAAVGTPDDACF